MVEYEEHGRVAVITIRRPEARNAVNGEVARGIEAALDRLEGDGDCWVGVLTGEGPVFSAGADLKEIAAGRAGELATEKGGFAGIARRDRRKPVVAAVTGPALAGGTEIVLSCDLVVAARSATFGLPEVKRSLVAGAGGLFRLPRLLGQNVAMEAALTGDPITAERAHQLGMVNDVVEEGDDVLKRALALAERVAANAPIAVWESRQVVLAAQHADEDTLWRMTTEAFVAVMQTEDFAEGPRAFIEKRPPEWKGR
ncbi:MAG TPA: crotonase/enoyl-CoA hydratase family protein [Acidimicrobiales bacterium]|nr:crotonase/enoyl-CoA hydratase family protein [Acidimicrobiales bacterium]